MGNQERLGGDLGSHVPSDCGSEGCGFNPRRSPRDKKTSSSVGLGDKQSLGEADARRAAEGVVSEIVQDDRTPTIERPNPLAYAAAYARRISLVSHFLTTGGRALARVLGGFRRHRQVVAVADAGIETDAPGWSVAEQPLTARLSRYVFTRSAVTS
jgi:hypothetical protein